MNYALITGATGGLGRAFCEIYAKNKYNLVITGTNEEKVNKLKDELETKFGIKVFGLVADLSKDSECRKVFEYTKNNNVFIHSLINCAGFGDRCDLTVLPLPISQEFI